MHTRSKATVRGLPKGRKALRLLHSLTFGTEGCPACAGTLRYRAAYAWCPRCRRKVRAKAASWLRGCKLPAETLLALLLAWQRKQSPGACVALLGLSYPTVARWYGRFRERLPEDRSKLSGPVELDESWFGRQRHANQVMVLGAKARSGGVRFKVAHERDGRTLSAFIVENVASRSLLLTDSHGGYGHAETLGYARKACDHSRGQFSETAGVEGVWSRCKRQVRRQYGQFYPFYLKGFFREWQMRAERPHLFSEPEAYLDECLVPR